VVNLDNRKYRKEKRKMSNVKEILFALLLKILMIPYTTRTLMTPLSIKQNIIFGQLFQGIFFVNINSGRMAFFFGFFSPHLTRAPLWQMQNCREEKS
jgi:hypothetical protein